MKDEKPTVGAETLYNWSKNYKSFDVERKVFFEREIALRQGIFIGLKHQGKFEKKFLESKTSYESRVKYMVLNVFPRQRDSMFLGLWVDYDISEKLFLDFSDVNTVEELKVRWYQIFRTCDQLQHYIKIVTSEIRFGSRFKEYHKINMWHGCIHFPEFGDWYLDVS